MNTDVSTNGSDSKGGRAVTRRAFLKYSAVTLSSVSLGSLTFGCGGGGSQVQNYPIDPNVGTTLDMMISFPKSIANGLAVKDMYQFSQYSALGYGNWTFGSPLPSMPRKDIMPATFSNTAPGRNTKLLNFFAFTDIHITDKEAPNQLLYLQQIEPSSYSNSSICSPVMMYTTHVLDAAIQTANALHKKNPFDFGISLGDTCNNTSYNELRWYIDVIDGKVITPSSGAHLGADSIDYQRPYQAAGLDKSIPWYQALGNHDHFYIGSFPVDADPTIGIRQAYVADTVWSVGDVLNPHKAVPPFFDMEDLKLKPAYYMGQLDGSNKYGSIINSGAVTDPAFAAGAPKTAPDPDRRSLARADWVKEFFNTTTNPVGHGFNLVDSGNPAWRSNGFACYSFVPNTRMPLKVIVLDNTQSDVDGSHDIHGHGYLDAERWAWLQSELAKGQAANQLMIIAAHVPIGVSAIGSWTEWWEQTAGIAPQYQNAVSLTDLVQTLQNTPNLLLWIAGHRHLNTVKAFISLDSNKPEKGFWQVETSSLRDFPQQFRTFEIYLNKDYTISIVTTNVDPAVAEGTPAAQSRRYAIGVQQITGNNVNENNQNFLTFDGLGLPNTNVSTIDPTQQQTDVPNTPDPTILYVDMTQPQFAQKVPVNGSYNAELFKQLSPQMINVLKAMFP